MVRFKARGQCIPPFVDLDVGELGLEQVRTSCTLMFFAQPCLQTLAFVFHRARAAH